MSLEPESIQKRNLTTLIELPKAASARSAQGWIDVGIESMFEWCRPAGRRFDLVVDQQSAGDVSGGEVDPRGPR